MLNTWLALRQIDEALQQGRLDDAYQRASQPQVRGYHHAGDLLKTLGLALLERARFRIKANELVEAWQDWQRAHELNMDHKLLTKVKDEWHQAARQDLRRCIEENQPKLVLERGQGFRALGLQDAELLRLEALSKAWLQAEELMQKGELIQAVKKIDAEDDLGLRALQTLRDRLLQQQERFLQLQTSLQDALLQKQWREVIRLTDELLVIAPQHHEFRRIRTAAWRELEPPTMPHIGKVRKVVQAETPAPDSVTETESESALPRRLILWVDGVGGFLVCLDKRVSIGQGAEGQVDIPILADISRLHAYLSRDGEGYVLEALRPVTVQQKASDKALLRDGDVIRLGTQCQLQFHQPVSISNTALLKIQSHHRLPLALDGIILMDETCLFGDHGDAHIRVSGLKKPVALLRRKDELWVQSAQPLEINGKPIKNRGMITLPATISGEDFRISLEPMAGIRPMLKGPVRVQPP